MFWLMNKKSNLNKSLLSGALFSHCKDMLWELIETISLDKNKN